MDIYIMSKFANKFFTGSAFEKEQTIEAISTVIKTRWFFVSLTLLQVFGLKFLTKSLSLTSAPIAILLVSMILGYNFLYWLYVRRPVEKISNWGLQIVKALQIIIDGLVICAMLYLNGTVNTFTSAFFLISIMQGSILYRKKGIIIAGFGVILFYTVLASSEFFGYFIYRPNPEALKFFSLLDNAKMFIRTVMVFDIYALATAIIAAYFADLNRIREERLKIQRDQLMGKTQVLQKQKAELTKTKNGLKRALDQTTVAKKEAEAARHSEEIEKNQVEAVIKNLTAGLIMLDQQGKVVLINDQAEKMLTINKSDLVAKRLSEQKDEDLIKLNQLIKTAEGKPLIKKEIIFDQPQESIFEVSTAFIPDVNKKIMGQVIVLNDITRERTVEKMKSEFITITAHQLRTPLTTLKWALGLLLNQDLGKISPEQKKIILQATVSNEQMINLIKDLLNLAQLEEGRFDYHFTKQSFNDLVEEAVANFRGYGKVKNISLVYKKPSREMLVDLDEEKIRLVLQNLIENAINYSRGGSKVIISSELEEKNLLFSIKDQGMGIAEKDKSRIFTKFFRGPEAVKKETEGNGLGLYLCKNIINGHGGRIWFGSEYGKGTTFYFSIPFNRS